MVIQDSGKKTYDPSVMSTVFACQGHQVLSQQNGGGDLVCRTELRIISWYSNPLMSCKLLYEPRKYSRRKETVTESPGAGGECTRGSSAERAATVQFDAVVDTDSRLSGTCKCIAGTIQLPRWE